MDHIIQLMKSLTTTTNTTATNPTLQTCLASGRPDSWAGRRGGEEEERSQDGSDIQEEDGKKSAALQVEKIVEAVKQIESEGTFGDVMSNW